jgi:multidrug efflux pump subunit AcrA (membrane-fusion protein)
MHPNPKRILPVIVVIGLIGLAGWYFGGFGRATADDGALTASGTIEAAEVNINPESLGRIVALNVGPGDPVKTGQTLAQLDTALVDAQHTQAAASLAAAQAAREAAQANVAALAANLALLKAGASAEQLQVAQTVIDKAQIAVDSAQRTYDDLPEAARDTTNGQALKTQLDTALATLANAQAQYAVLAAGARPEQITAAEAQLAAAQAQVEATQAQVDAAQAALGVLEVQKQKLTLTAPLDGVVLERAAEPGEVTAPGATLLVLADLSQLALTVYLPEDRYGQITLNQTATVTVDSFAGQTFTAHVIHMADQAEFTPRNVQTTDGRKTTVFAIRLRVNNPDNKLKPGMPADVVFGK